MKLLAKRMLLIALSVASAITLIFSHSAEVQARDNDNQTFLDWCLQYDELPEATQYSVQYLLANADTDDCHEANETLTTQTKLRKRGPAIRGDFQPFASLTAVTDIEFRLVLDGTNKHSHYEVKGLPV